MRGGAHDEVGAERRALDVLVAAHEVRDELPRLHVALRAVLLIDKC